MERVVKTANKLFYEEGIGAVGVDRIVAEAGVSKASLYANFRTKDDLVVNYLRDRSTEWQEHVRVELPKRATAPVERILAIFDLLGEWFVAPGYRGCPFINAEAECGPAQATHAVTIEHRAWVREMFTDSLVEIGIGDPPFVALQLVQLYDGSMVGAQAEPQHPWAAAARDAAAAILSAAPATRLTPAD